MTQLTAIQEQHHCSVYATYWYHDFNGFFHWNRYIIANAALQAGLMDALKHLSSTFPYSSLSHNDDVDELLLQHKMTFQTQINQFIGTIAHAYGDVANDGLMPTAA